MRTYGGLAPPCPESAGVCPRRWVRPSFCSNVSGNSVHAKGGSATGGPAALTGHKFGKSAPPAAPPNPPFARTGSPTRLGGGGRRSPRAVNSGCFSRRTARWVIFGVCQRDPPKSERKALRPISGRGAAGAKTPTIAPGLGPLGRPDGTEEEQQRQAAKLAAKGSLEGLRDLMRLTAEEVANKRKAAKRDSTADEDQRRRLTNRDWVYSFNNQLAALGVCLRGAQ